VTYPHEDKDFAALLRIVAKERGVSEALVEKDYWVTHTLWALAESKLDVWFKGGTSLSKGFGLINRFSEDLDLKIDRGAVSDLPPVASWTSKNNGPIGARRAFYEGLVAKLAVPGAPVEIVAASLGKEARGAEYHVAYPGEFRSELPPAMKPVILLEVGDARVVPFVERPIASWVHETIEKQGQLGAFVDNRAKAIRCVHPLVTLLDKLDAVSSRFAKAKDAATFVRHYEDAAQIIRAAGAGKLPPLEQSARQLADDMLGASDIRAIPVATDPSLDLPAGARRDEVERAYNAIGTMFWGERIPLDDALAGIRAWCARVLV
jgi:hypothetical protein